LASHSTVSAVKAAIHEGLVASLAGVQIGTTAVQVAYSHPGEALRNTAAFLGDVKWPHIEPPVMRGGRRVAREENYTVEVHFLACTSGTDSSASDAAVLLMYGALEDVLATTPTLGVDGVAWALPSAGELRSGFDETRNGWASSLQIDVGVKARLS
jgi:hypothetical protein